MGVGTVRGLIAVNQDEIGGWVQRLDGASHSEHSRLENIEGINGLLLHHAETDGYRLDPDCQVELLASARAERLGVVHSIDHAGRRKDHSGSYDRPGQRPSSDLINTRNEVIACGTERGLHLCRRQHSDSLYFSLRSKIRAAFPFSFRR